MTEVIAVVSKYADPKIIFIVVDALSENGEDFCKSIIDVEILVDMQDFFPFIHSLFLFKSIFNHEQDGVFLIIVCVSYPV